MAAAVAAALTAALLAAAPGAAAPSAGTAPSADQVPVVVERGDAVTAQIAAKAQGSKVEVTGERTESRRVWANPDGSFTAEVFSGPNWVQRADGTWDEIDTTLTRDSSGDVVPKAAAVEVTLAGDAAAAPSGTAINVVAEVAVPRSSLDDFADAQTDPTATVPVTDDAGARPASVSVGTDGALPAPVVSGNEATYAGAADGRDLRVRVLPSGVQTFVDIAERPAEIPAEGVVVSLPLAAKGVTVAESPDGGIVLRDAKTGEVVSRAPAARVWDANIDPVSGESSHGFVADTQLRKTSTGYDLSVVIPAAYFDTPGLRYPVTVDPSYTFTTVSKDTYVEKGYDNTAFGSEPDLKVGTYDGGTHVARSYVAFTLSDAGSLFLDRTYDRTVIESAKLKLWLYHSASCTAATMGIRYLTGSFSETTSTWTSKPAQSAAIYNVSDAKRNDSSGACAEGWLDTSTGTDVTSIVQDWVGRDDDDPGNYGFALTASETSSSGWKRFYSSEHSTSSRRPSMTVTYHHRPTIPTAMSIAGRNTAGWVRSATPSLSATVADLDGGSVAGAFYVSTSSTFTSTTWSGSSSGVTSGTTATKMSGTLAQGTQYYARARASQAYSTTTEYSAYTAGVPFKVDSVTPAVTIDCGTGQVAENAFVANSPGADVACDADASDATSLVNTFTSITLDGGTTGILTTTGTGATRSFSLAQTSLTPGWHTLAVTVTDNAGNSTTKNYEFGIGEALVDQLADEQTTGSGTVALRVTAPSGVSAHIQYSTDGTTWTAIPAAALRSLTGATVTTPLTLTTGTLKQTIPVRWDMTSTFTDDTVVFVRPCILPTAGASCSAPSGTDPLTVTLDRSGAGAASTSVGPATVSLTTGSASLSASDASVGAAAVGRSYNSYSANVDGPFGKGWSTSLAAAAGSQWSHLVDNGASVLVYASEGGDPTGFANAGSGAAPCSVTYTSPADATHLTLCKNTTTTPATFTLTEEEGPVAAFANLTGSKYVVASVTDPITGDVTDFDANGYGITRILPPLPPGVAPTDCGATTTTGWAVGCTDLVVNYSSTPRVQRITWRGFEQPLDGSTPILRTYDVACYRYDASNRLTQVWDPRDNTGGYAACGTGSSPADALITGYAYDTSSGRLTQITPPGLRPWVIAYNSSDGRVTSVSRTHGAGFNGGATETTTIQYNVAIGAATSTDDTHPDLTATAAASWWPADPVAHPVTAPVTATAVYPPGASTTDLRNATITAMDELGRDVMTAAFSGSGQSGWKVATQVLDPGTGAVVASLTPGNRDAALDPSSRIRTEVGLTGTTADAARMLASLTVTAHLVDDNDDGTIDSEDIPDTTDTYGPLHLADIDGTPTAVRTHTSTTYGTRPADVDPASLTAAQRATEAKVHSPLQVVEAAWEPSTGTDIASTVQTATYGYAYTAAGTETTTGWKYGTPIQTTVVMPGGTDIVNRTVLNDNTGAVVQTRQPSAKNDSLTTPTDPGTRLTRTWQAGTYDAATCTATVWYGMPCDARPAGGNLPAATQTFYDLFRRPIKQTDTGTGGTTRTTLTAYANGGISSRPASVQTTGGASGDTPIPDKTVSYHTATGLPSGTASGSGGSAITTSTSYDDFGRPLNATDGSGGQSTVTYESTTGRLATVARTQGGTTVGTTTYAYNGGTERRGLATGAAHSTLGTITAVYDADGQPISQTIPMVTGTLTQAWTRSSVGRATELDWTRSGATDPWITDTVTVDAHGRVATDTSTLYAVGGRVRGYTYDAAGRLTGVSDTREAACTTRTYGFDVNGNRTASASYAPAVDGSCQTTTATSTASGSFTAADQPYLPGGGTLAYDAFGRTTTLPAGQTPAASGSDVSLSYFVNDLVRSTTATPAGGSSLTATWSLDASDRLACRRDKPTATTDASACGSTSTAGVVDTINHYEGGSDSPAWTITRSGGTTPTTTTAWYVPGLVGGLAATVTGSSATVALSDLHGDVPISTTTTQTAAPDGAITDTDEYGVVRDTTGAATTGPRYAWLGTAQRDATAAAGLTLMGVRLYSPVIGRFLSTDPVYGGNTTTYGYPADPINGWDITGRNYIGREGGYLSGDWRYQLRLLIERGYRWRTMPNVTTVAFARGGYGISFAITEVYGRIFFSLIFYKGFFGGRSLSASLGGIRTIKGQLESVLPGWGVCATGGAAYYVGISKSYCGNASGSTNETALMVGKSFGAGVGLSYTWEVRF